jgi:hypothetical protein
MPDLVTLGTYRGLSYDLRRCLGRTANWLVKGCRQPLECELNAVMVRAKSGQYLINVVPQSMQVL